LSQVSSIAHVHADCGTFVVPAQSPYERQLLREHVEMFSGRVSALTLGMDGARWIVTRHASADLRCAECTQVLGRVSCSRGDHGAPMCIECAIPPGAHTGEEHEA
jgi:hypothetical protein